MNTAFIGLDYIVEITHPDGKLAASASQVRERGVIAGANKALQIARLDGWLSIRRCSLYVLGLIYTCSKFAGLRCPLWIPTVFLSCFAPLPN